MEGTNVTIAYSQTRAPLSPVFATVSFTIAILPVLAIPFAPSGREFNLAVGMILLGTLFSPVNAGVAAYLVHRYKGQAGARTLAVFAAIIAGLNAGLLLLAIAGIAMHGMPC